MTARRAARAALALAVCPTCGLSEPQVEFRPGHRQCVLCIHTRQAKWRYDNRKRLRTKNRKYMRKWRAANPGYSGRKTPQVRNPEKQRQYKAKYLSKPGKKAHANEQSRAYYTANRERILAQKKAKKLRKVQL